MELIDIALFLGFFSFIAILVTWAIIVKLYQNIKSLNVRINTIWESMDDRYNRILHGWRDTIETAQELIDVTSELINDIKGENDHDSE